MIHTASNDTTIVIPHLNVKAKQLYRNEALTVAYHNWYHNLYVCVYFYAHVFENKCQPSVEVDIHKFTVRPQLNTLRRRKMSVKAKCLLNLTISVIGSSVFVQLCI